MSLRLDFLIAIAIACDTRRAAADRAIVVDAPGAPFEGRELAEALRVRVAADGAPLHVRVTTTPAGVRIEARGGTRDVELAGLHGAAAARLVALAASDLLLDDLATPPSSVEPPAATVGVLGSGALWDGTVGGLSIDLAIPEGGWLATAEIGAGTAIAGNVRLVSGVARLGPGVRFGMIELRVGATLVPVLVATGAGDRTVLVGGGASARLRVPVGEQVRAVLAVGADAFATTTHYALDGMTVLTTPTFAPWLALGMEVRL